MDNLLWQGGAKRFNVFFTSLRFALRLFVGMFSKKYRDYPFALRFGTEGGFEEYLAHACVCEAGSLG